MLMSALLISQYQVRPEQSGEEVHNKTKRRQLPTVTRKRRVINTDHNLHSQNIHGHQKSAEVHWQ